MLPVLTRAGIGPSAGTPIPVTVTYYGKTAMISSIGAIVIEVLTVVSALYLFRPLHRQGIVKLRTKYLIGMVASDVALG